MHPVLADAVFPLAEHVAAVSLKEAQVSPAADTHGWNAQQVVEHLILSFRQSTEELQKRLKLDQSPSRSASWLQWIIKIQVCVFHSMTRGVSTSSSLRPRTYIPQDGPELAARLCDEAELLNKTLAESRIAFGMRPCGYHPVYGPLRVEEWRVYHAVHCRHHMRQFDAAIAYAQNHPAEMEQARAAALPLSKPLARNQ